MEKAFPAEMRPPARLPVARELGERSLMFFVHPTLGVEHIAFTCEVVRAVMKEASN